MKLRLDKYLADAGFGTRSEVKQLIRKCAVQVNGTPAAGPEQKVDITLDAVTVDGKPVFFENVSYYILNKPAGILSASRDGREKTVIDLIPEPKRRDLFPVGRLDRDTVGLLLITNDGKLSNRLMAPGKHVPKTYRATVSGSLPEDLAERFAAGVDIGDETLTAPAEVRVLGPEGPLTQVELTLTEGRYHQVKRMFEAVGCRVTALERISIGKLTLPEDLQRGEVRKVEYEELIAGLGI